MLTLAATDPSKPLDPFGLVRFVGPTREPAVTTSPDQHVIQRIISGAIAAATLLLLTACSSAPIPSFDERQPDDVVQSKAAQSVATSRSPAGAAPKPRAAAVTAAASAVAGGSKLDAGTVAKDSGEHDAGTRDGDAGAVDTPNGTGETHSSENATHSDQTEIDGGTSDDAGPIALDQDATAPREAHGDAGLSSALVSDATSWDDTLQQILPFGETICPAVFLDELHYAEGNEFWLGDQSEMMLRVDGFGYFAAQGADGANPAQRYTPSLALSVRPDGTLEDPAGYEVLGYGPNADDPCLTTLRAPISLPARPTTALTLAVNLQSQPNEPREPFDVATPAASAIAAPFSVPLIDVDGRKRSLTVYFEHTGAGSFRYHVLVAQSDVTPESTGFEELGFGDLQFDADGALVTAASPLLCVHYVEASGSQCFTFDFGPAIADDGAAGPDSSTSKDSPTALTKLTNDGYPAGTSTKLNVDAQGAVSVVLDNGQSRRIGSLALARFPNEAALATVDVSAVRQTIASGMPAFGAPSSPGRGTVTH